MKKRGHFYALRINGVPETRQGLIFYLCLCYAELSEGKQRILDELYKRIGGEHAAALRAVMETKESYSNICTRYCIASPTTLWQLRAKLYREFPLDEIMK